MKDLVIKAVITTVVTAAWGFCVWICKRAIQRQKELDKRQDAVEDGLRSLLRAEIIRTYEKTRERGYCPIYSKESISHCADAYGELNGNGVVPGLVDFILAAPTSKQAANREEENRRD